MHELEQPVLLYQAREEWRLPLLVSLLEIRDSNWAVNFDEEVGGFKEDEITNLISTVCV